MFTDLRIGRRVARRFAPIVLAAVMLVPSGAAAGEATTRLFADTVGRFGPSGVMVFAGGARRWSREDEPSLMAHGRYIQLSATLGINPAYGQGSLAAEWVPVAPLQLRLQYDAFAFFGTNGALLRFQSPAARFGPDELDGRIGGERTGIGHRVMFSPVLRAKVGRLVIRNQSDVDRYVLSRSSGWYYEWEYDTLLAASDWLIANRTALMVELWRGAKDATLLVGPMYDITRAGAAKIIRQRVGLSAYWAPAARWLGFDRPKVYALAGVNLSDRNREGEPFALLGVGGDFEFGSR